MQMKAFYINRITDNLPPELLTCDWSREYERELALATHVSNDTHHPIFLCASHAQDFCSQVHALKDSEEIPLACGYGSDRVELRELTIHSTDY